MDNEKLKERFAEATSLMVQANNIEVEVAEAVGNKVYEWLDLGKKTKALEVINEVYSNEDYDDKITAERNTYWFLHYQKIIYEYMK